jgi:hypothetical protein
LMLDTIHPNNLHHYFINIQLRVSLLGVSE